MLDSEIASLLERMVAEKASDLFLSVGAKPLIKVEGQFYSMGETVLDAQTVSNLCYSTLTDDQRKVFESTHELNLSVGLNNIARFRLNLFRQRGNPALVARHINNTIPDFNDLNLPSLLGELVMEDRGLILLVGGTGTGKSSSLAAMLAHRSKSRGGHILTIEDPIEFLHSHHNNSLINQREVGLDTDSFEAALHNAMREAPNVIMIGEIRDLATMKHALAYAETGHLCLSTLHANNANQAIERILNFFPDTAHAQILQDLSLNLRAVISQRLIIGLEKKRVPAIEIMLNTPFISELISSGKIDQLKDAMNQASAMGCKTLDEALYQLVVEKKISQEESLRHADSRTNLALRFKLEGTEAKKIDNAASKDISYVKQIDFRSYRTFRVNCALFKCTNSELKFQIETALRAIGTNKGLVYQFEHPDIEIRFIFNAPPEAPHAELALMLEDDSKSPQKPPKTTAETMNETLIIAMFDMHRAESVWRMRTSLSLAADTLSQEQITNIFTGLLDAYPPRQIN